MDTLSYPPPVLQKTLNFLALTNRWFGGVRVILDFLSPWSRRWDKKHPIRLLDVGTGGADIPRAVALWARSQGFKVQITALELMPALADIARRNAQGFPEIRVRQKDFFQLAEKAETFDYVIASLFLHHTPAEKTARTLQSFDRLAEKGVIISDLLRSQASYWSVKLLSRWAGNSVVRHDGPLSVRRAFQPAELEGMAWSAGLSYLRARRHPWFRVSLAGEKTGEENHRPPPSAPWPRNGENGQVRGG
jgi:SAM-dependent methyltransferase